MKVSLNTLKGINHRYGCVEDITAIGVDKLIEKIGSQLGGVDGVVDLGVKYKGIIIVKVVECVRHPDADKLSLCRVDDGGVVQDVERGEDGLVQVVCGAPNVRAGMFAAWLPPGSTVPETVGKEPFVLEARELRGRVSNGMLASPKELALGDSHAGIIELDEHRPGTDFAEAYGLKDDIIVDIENKMFTHRPDCFGFLGLSREIAGIQQLKFTRPDWYVIDPEIPAIESDQLPLKVTNEVPNEVKRFMMLVMDNVKVGPSPAWLIVELAKVGQKSINNIVDYTNWFMLETGQPMHAYDYDKVKAQSDGDPVIVVRHSKTDEKIKLLNGKEIVPRDKAIMIATDKQAIGIGGVMGGTETEVDENTTRIILECGTFDMYSVRRTSMEHGLFTDAVTRFTKGQSPFQNGAVLAKIVEEIRQAAGGKVASELFDDSHFDDSLPSVKVTPEFINKRLGLDLSADQIGGLLRNVEFAVLEENGELEVNVPFWRTDIEIPEDIVEEVGRLYGYDELPLELPVRSVTPTRRDPMFDLKAQIRDRLAHAGANEVLTYSFVHGDLIKKVGQDPDKAFQVANALSPDLQYYRLSLTPSLLDKVHPNIKAGHDSFALFEIGKAHLIGQEEDGLPKEFERVALVFAATKKAARAGAAYYEVRKYLEELLKDFGLVDSLRFEPMQSDDEDVAAKYYAIGRSAKVFVGDKLLGRIGEYKSSVARNLKLPATTAGFELGLSLLLETENYVGYAPLSRFPKITQDVTLRLPAETTFQAVNEFIAAQLSSAQNERDIVRLSPVSIYQSDEGSSHKNFTFRLEIASYDRTLTDKEINKLLDEVAAVAKSIQAERV